MLQPLKSFVKNKALLPPGGDDLVELIQQRRNTIHAFQPKELGAGAEFQNAVRGYLWLLKDINLRLPYPDEIFAPTDT